MASLAPARAEIEAGVVAKADQYLAFSWCQSSVNLDTFPHRYRLKYLAEKLNFGSDLETFVHHAVRKDIPYLLKQTLPMV